MVIAARYGRGRPRQAPGERRARRTTDERSRAKPPAPASGSVPSRRPPPPRRPSRGPWLWLRRKRGGPLMGRPALTTYEEVAKICAELDQRGELSLDRVMLRLGKSSKGTVHKHYQAWQRQAAAAA